MQFAHINDMYQLGLVCKKSNKTFENQSVWKGKINIKDGEWVSTKTHAEIPNYLKEKYDCYFDFCKKLLKEWKYFNKQFNKIKMYNRLYENQQLSRPNRNFITCGIRIIRYAHENFVQNNPWVHGLIVPEFVPLSFYKWMCNDKPASYIDLNLLEHRNNVYRLPILHTDIGCEFFENVFNNAPNELDGVNYNTTCFLWAEKQTEYKREHHSRSGVYIKLDISEEPWKFYGREWPERQEDLTDLEMLERRYLR